VFLIDYKPLVLSLLRISPSLPSCLHLLLDVQNAHMRMTRILDSANVVVITDKS